MKQIIAILIAFFVCASATQVSAQKVLQLKIVTSEDYTVEPTDECVFLTGPSEAVAPALSIVRLPDPTLCKGRVIQILNRKNYTITIHPFLGGSFNPLRTMLRRHSSAWVSDGSVWYILNKSYEGGFGFGN